MCGPQTLIRCAAESKGKAREGRPELFLLGARWLFAAIVRSLIDDSERNG